MEKSIQNTNKNINLKKKTTDEKIKELSTISKKINETLTKKKS